LIFVDDTVGAPLAAIVDEIVRVEACPAVAQLYDPGPYLLRRRPIVIARVAPLRRCELL